MKKYVLSIDQGTTSSRAILFDKEGTIVATAQKEIEMFYDGEDYVEQDANDIYDSVIETIKIVLKTANVTHNEIASIGITNQRETTILWDKRTGEPIYRAIVWQSKQSKDICQNLINNDYNELFKQKTGLLIDPYFSATKIRWVLNNVKGAEKLMRTKNLSFGTVDSWLLYRLTGKKVHKTDYTNASRTLLYNIFTKEWDAELLDLLGIHDSVLPEVVSSDSLFGYTDETGVFGEKIMISGILGDQQAALFGQLCIEKGSIKNTYGTGCFMLMNIGETPTLSNNGLLTTIAYSINDKVTYALEGSVFVAGSAVQWLRDALTFFKDAKDSETLAKAVTGNYGVYFVPAFVGLGTPYWDTDAKGAIFGLTRGTTKEHITRATLESLAYQTRDIIDVMEKESHISPTFLKVDGGASQNNFLMQFQADISNINIKRPKISESTALGAAFMSGLSSGFYKNLESLKEIVTLDKTFTPRIAEDIRQNLYSKWQTAVAATRLFK